MTFEAALKNGVFLDDWKKDNIVPVRKKDLRTMLINHPISLLPIFAKIFEKIVFTSMFEYFIENELFTVCQLVFFQVILALHNSEVLYMKYTNHLIKAHLQINRYLFRHH